MKSIQSGIAIFLFVLFLYGCEESIIGKEPSNTPGNNFDLVWNNFNERYGLFEVKNIDWLQQYNTFRPMLNENSNDQDLYNVLTGMLKTLNDNHVTLITTNENLPSFISGNLGSSQYKIQEDYNAHVVQDHYIDFLKIASGDIMYGTLKGANVGYILLSRAEESLSSTRKAVDQVIVELQDTKGIIIDIRSHSGGYDYLGQYIAGKFSTSKKLFMTTRRKNGPAHDDFTDEQKWYVEPAGDKQYLKTVILLTSRFTLSAGETFALAMNQNEHVIQWGDTTAGAFSDQITTEMYNGWVYTISTGDYRAADGLSYEGKGLAPDSVIVDTKEELDNGVDKLLEMAISKLN